MSKESLDHFRDIRASMPRRAFTEHAVILYLKSGSKLFTEWTLEQGYEFSIHSNTWIRVDKSGTDKLTWDQMWEKFCEEFKLPNV